MTNKSSNSNKSKKKVERPYKVRLSFEDTKSQLSSFTNLDAAKKKVDENPDYKVYDGRNGQLLYGVVKTVKEDTVSSDSINCADIDCKSNASKDYVEDCSCSNTSDNKSKIVRLVKSIISRFIRVHKGQ